MDSKIFKYVSPERIGELINKLSELLSGYVTAEQLAQAISSLTGLSYFRVDTYESLMQGYQSGEAKYKSTNTIYLVGITEISAAGDSVNRYDEYLYLGDEASSAAPYEKIGVLSTEVDLEGYVTNEDLEEMSSLELEEMWNQAFNAEI